MADASTRSSIDRQVARPYDTTIHYTVSGPDDGPVVVLVHGWACSRHDFDEVTENLPAGYRVVAVDLAEHGDSRSSRAEWTMAEFAQDVLAVIEAESISRAVVVGHSLGGAVAVEVGGLLPDVVTHVVALDALHYLFLFPAVAPEAAAAIMTPFREDFPTAVRGMVEAGSPADTDPALKDKYAAIMGAARQPAGLNALEGLVNWDMDAALAQVRQPVTLFAVQELLSQEAIDRYGARITIVPVDLGSHHFQVEDPRGTAALIASIPVG